ncbi:ribonuclease P protein component [Magnetovibrio blakemorei]|uniref:Ribonuclease P protein component n=2 Tax=Magnetovibrio blakemorei TaxID=28181 RepID=A0A1E5QBA0_9PROT|nr:ribonuclease P protein component [Magnetovibrio blakemorei]
MASAAVWQPLAVAAFWQHAAPKAVSACPLNSRDMGPRIERLKKRPEFLRVAATRKKWAAPGFILQVKSHPANAHAARTDGFLRVGFTVSKKVGNSVERNRAKRRLRALAAEILPEHAAAGFDLVLIGRRATLTRPYAQLVDDLLKALKKMGIATPITTQVTTQTTTQTEDAQ